MTVQELNTLLDELDIKFYESGACYDSAYESFMSREIEYIEQTYQLSVVEF